MPQTEALTSNHLKSHADDDGGFLSAFVKYAQKVTWGCDSMKRQVSLFQENTNNEVCGAPGLCPGLP